MRHLIKRRIGQILLDGKFMSTRELDHALEEQKHTKELLGQVLVRMGVVKERDFKIPLIVQQHLGDIDEAVEMAAGERELLGVLLVHSGFLTSGQLDRAIDEQKISGEKIGEVFVRLGMLKERQLVALLDFQHKQRDTTPSPLRLGELLVATGHISRKQLDDAIAKQKITHKKLGEVLVEEGYARPSLIKYGICMQRMLVSSVLTGILSLSLGGTGVASSVSLQWDPSSSTDVTGYKVYDSSDSSSLPGSVPIDVQMQTTATISGLDPTNAYSFAVTAYNASGVESGFSNIVSIAEQSPPVVAIASPTNAINVGGTVSISVNATDNVGVSKVEFYVNGVLKASDIASPYVYSWNTTTLTPGTYTLLAKAYDAAGNIGQSAVTTVTVVNDAIAPTVAVTSPVNNATVSGTVVITSSASDNVGVSNVEFYANDVFLYAGNVAPYSYSWNTAGLANGVYMISAKAYDNAGNSQLSSAVAVTVNNVVPDVTAPTVNSFAFPSTASSLSVPVSMLTASDNIAVTGYLITESSTKPAAGATGWSSSPPTSFTFSSAGTKTAYAWAKDAAGNVSNGRSTPVTITLPDTIAPTVALSNVVANSTVSGTVSVGASAADNIGVIRVEFYVNGILNATSTTSPYSFSWNTTSLANGPYTLTSKAYDASGNVGQSAAVPVTVSNLVPSVGTLLTAWSAATVPGIIDSGPDGAVELGVKFRSDTAGSIAGIRFYKAGTNTGTHIGNLWDTTGKLLATATFANETASGWQQVTFPTPVAISANTVYVASYHTNVGHYSDDQSYFAGKGVDNGSLHLLADGVSGASGVYSYGTTSKYPNLGWKSSNYWVDVAYQTAVVTSQPDITAPTLNSFTFPVTSTTLTVPVSTFTASDNVAVTGYMITESSTKPAASATGWTASAPVSFTFSSEGFHTAYAWVKDVAGNVSSSRTASVTISIPDVTAPTVNSFAFPSTASSLSVPVSMLTASDNIAVTGYLITESSTKPAAGATGWSSSPQTSFTFSSAGTKTAYAWAKDAAGNVSNGRSTPVTITLPDTIAPTVALSNVAANSTVSGTVAVGASAADNIGVIRVEFYVNGILNATSTTSPYSFSWNTTSLANGPYTLTSKAYDASGNVGQSAAVPVTVSNLVPSVGTLLTAWSAATVPGIVDSGPDAAVELGVKFRSDTAGSIAGIRFYKAGTNTGTHIGNLWDTTGKLLATATFANESASGWQQVTFRTPVAIKANTVYVASYHTNVGHYSDDQNYFAGKGVDNGSLHLLADGVSGASGVYSYGTTSKFPNLGWKSSNYWVDVVFKK